MNTTNNIKHAYIAPAVVCVKLDNEIALILQSDPMPGPSEGFLQPEYFNKQPYQSDLV